MCVYKLNICAYVTNFYWFYGLLKAGKVTVSLLQKAKDCLPLNSQKSHLLVDRDNRHQSVVNFNARTCVGGLVV